MTDFYNDFEPFACQWMRNLIEAGEIPEGEVDGRSIKDITPEEINDYRRCHFFAGIGGWPLALRLAGWPESVPVWTGSCPCQPYSPAGKGLGDEDPRNLWPDFFRLICQCRPVCVFGEQVEGAIGHGWLDGISADLEGEDYAVGSCVLGAHSVGAPHIRQRLFWVAYASGTELGRRRESSREHGGVLHATDGGDTERLAFSGVGGPQADGRRNGADASGCGVAHGLADAGCGGVRSDGFGTTGTTPQGVCGEAREQRIRPDAGAGCATAGWLADARSSPPRDAIRSAKDDAGKREQGAAELAGGRSSGFWHDARIIPCRDGKARRVGTGISPLAHGLSRDLGQRFPALRGILPSARRNRAGRLKGYGNAIVPQVAAVFVRAFMESQGIVRQQ